MISINHPLKVAILCSFNLELIARSLTALLKEKGFKPEFYFCGYGQWETDALNPSSGLYQFKPDLVFLFLEFSDLFSSGLLSETEAHALGESTWSRVEIITHRLLETLSPQTFILCHNLLVNPVTPLRLLEGNAGYSLTSAAEAFNRNLRDRTAQNPRLLMVDYASLVVQEGWKTFYDQRLWHLGRIRLSRTGLNLLAQYYLRYICALTTPRRKCLVLDLDNTLWGGVIGEDGLMGIQLGHEGIGLAYREFQMATLALSQRGVILAICSKNNPQDALNVLRDHPDSILRPEHFACLEMNWEPKPENLRQIAQKLNIGLESLVFWDDSPIEREIVGHQLPEVLVVEVPEDVSDYADHLLELDCFDSLSLTQTDLHRAQMYHQQAQRERYQEQSQSDSLEAFYHSLKIVVTIREANDFALPRITQLTQRTNQFNLTTQRYTEPEILAMKGDCNYRLYSLQLQDRFGDLGIVGAAIIHQKKESWTLENLLMSCRALGRSVEDTFLRYLTDQAKNHGTDLYGTFRPTSKNMPARAFLAKYGLAPPEGWNKERWNFVVPLALLEQPTWITITESEHAAV
jgi:FkbH-like protein